MELNSKKEPVCANCDNKKGRHKAITLNCPFGRGNFPQFKMDQVFKERQQ
jgi:hypothetical protein